MATPMTLRCRTRSAVHSIKDLDSTSTFLDLKAFIVSLTGLDCNKFCLKSGFPPTLVSGEDDSLLVDCGVKNGDLIIVEESKRLPSRTMTNQNAVKRPASVSHNDVIKKLVKEVSIKRKVVPANNSCLFASIDFCINGSVDQMRALAMRQVVADAIASDPEKYTEAFLGGKTPKEYADWVLTPTSWGGAIELSILCDHYAMEIDVVDIQYTRVQKFGESHDNRILLLYDGIHYDPLYEDSQSGQRTIFSVRDDEVLTRAHSLADQEKANRMYTDPKNFTLQCLVCGKGLAGGVEATQHAKETSHTNFKEY